MKFFTPEWYESASDDQESLHEFKAIADRYNRHLNEMEGALPAEILALARNGGVDDALVIRLRRDRPAKTLVLTLRSGNLIEGYYDLVLDYRGVEIATEHEETLLHIARTTLGQFSYQFDGAYEEFDRTPDGRFEHRLLFNGPRGESCRWFAIQCTALRWTVIPRQNRRFTHSKNRISVVDGCESAPGA